MKINVVTLTKDQIPRGYSQNVEIFPFVDHENSLRIIERNHIPRGNVLISTAMTSSSIIKAMNYEYYPQLARYEVRLDSIFDPRTIYTYCENDMDYERPNIDIVKIDTKEHDFVSLLTFTKGAPVIIFYAKDTKMLCVGVILKQALLKYGKDVFTNIIKSLGKDIVVDIPLCTHYDYDDVIESTHIISKMAEHCSGFSTKRKLGRLDKYIEKTIGDIITELNNNIPDGVQGYNCSITLGKDTQDDCYFGREDTYNNPVIVNVTRKDNPNNTSEGYDLV